MSTIGKALDVMETILKHGDEIGIQELAGLTSLNRTTAYRISSILVKRGYLYQKNNRGKYSLGLKMLQYANSSNSAVNIREQALPYLQNLCDEISETVNMAILNGIEPVNIAVVAADRIIQVVPGVIQNFPLHCTAIGKIFLADMQDGRLDNIANIVGLKAYTDNTKTDLVQLKKEIETVKRDGVAFDNEEYLIGVRSTAAPVKDSEGKVLSSISLVGPSIRLSKPKMLQLSPIVKNCALKISQSLGYKGE